MKHNWEYKRLGDICDIVRGGSPRPIQDYLTDAADGLNWIKIGDVAAGSKYITSTKEKIKKEGLVKTRQVFKGDFILSNSMSFGRPYILKIDGCIHDGWLAIKGVENHFIADFLYYFLSSPSTYSLFEKLVKGGVVSNLNSDIVRGIDVPLPPMDVQEQIVGELDKINELIDDCRELLRILDALAQSLFYDTFGDPISNPKGWILKKLSDECTDIVDGDHSAPPKATEGVPFITISNIDKYTNSIDFSNSFFVPQSYYDALKSNRKARNGDVLYTVTGSYGITVLIENQPNFCFQRHIGLLRPKHTLNSVFLAHWGRSSAIKSYADKVATGIAQKTVSLTSLRNFPLILPPLTLQEEFAERIEAIEAIKATTQQQLAALQTLFDSRMDYWFN